MPDPCSRTFELNQGRGAREGHALGAQPQSTATRSLPSPTGSTFKSEHFFPAYPPLNSYVDKAKDAGVYDVDELWKHDPDRQEIIESKGYTMGSDGYYAKDGTQLTLDIATHEAFIEKQRIAQVLVEQLQAIGINASNAMRPARPWRRTSTWAPKPAWAGRPVPRSTSPGRPWTR